MFSKALTLAAVVLSLTQPIAADHGCKKTDDAKQCTWAGSFSWEVDPHSTTMDLYDNQCNSIGHIVNPAIPGPFYSQLPPKQMVVLDSLAWPTNDAPGHIKFASGASTVETDILFFRNQYWNDHGKAPNCDCDLSGEQGCENDTCCSCTFQCHA